MKASWNWLTDYVAVKAPAADVADRLTMAGLTVEDIDKTPEDICFDIEITSNRPDWLSHIGIAREIAALYGLALHVPAVELPPAGGPVADEAALEVPDADLCPLYTGRVIKGVKIAPSPAWLREKVESIGLRSINNVVDITNYVMYECGQPLHAFDLAKLAGRKIIVRRAVSGEQITLIDETKHTLTDSDLVIADGKMPVALAGIMGGAESEIGDETSDVFVESAQFDQYSVRTTAKRLGISTDASYRFERGVDVETVDWASRRTGELIVEIAGGTLCEGVLKVGVERGARPEVRLRMSRVRRILGIDVPIEETRTILASLDFVLRGGSPDETVVEVPSFRGDVKEEIDLIEEVARIKGYDKIPFAAALKVAVGRRNPREIITEAAEEVLTACGFYGCVSYSLVTGDLFRKISPWTREDPVYIENRPGHEDTFLRPSLVGSLLLVRKTNEDRKVPDADVYEVAHVYLPSSDTLPDQPLMAAAVTGRGFPAAKGIVERLFQAIGAEAVEFEPCDFPFLAPGEAASIISGGEMVGFIGRLDSSIVESVNLRTGVSVAEINLGRFEARPRNVESFKTLQRFPGVERDLALVVRESVKWAEIVSCIEGAGAEYLDSISFISLYRGKPIPEGSKSVALHVVFRSPEKTLTGEEADRTQALIVGILSERLGATLR
ncbi:MAG: phenylalanine--tRNA ligase subunit beta [Planctomycetes bacterium]|nr:phenylalanine--tRNA ligase subunit beta [Planctomycetota bacterium]